MAKADGDSYTESLKSGGTTFLVLLEAARCARPRRRLDGIPQ